MPNPFTRSNALEELRKIALSIHRYGIILVIMAYGLFKNMHKSVL